MKQWYKSRFLRGTALPVILLWATSANAQQAEAPAAQQSAEDSKLDETIVVTGSRLVRNGYEAPTPVTVATTVELAKSAPATIADGLNKLPQFFGSRGNNGSTGAGYLQGVAPTSGNYLNLRNIGLNRVLILMDGIRMPPTSVEGLVDTNTIPQALVERVEVVTGGVSAVYGADAVSGVVNFILDKKFTGLKGTVSYGQTEAGDAKNYKISLAGGLKFAEGRGHIVASVEHYNNTGVSSYRDRPYLFPGNFNNQYFLAGTGTAADPYRNIQGPIRNVSVSAGGLISSVMDATGANNPAGAALVNLNFLSPSVFAPFQFGTPTGNSQVRVGGDGVTGSPDTSITPTLRTNQAFINTSYEFSDNVTGFVRASYATSENTSNTANDNRTGPGALFIFSGNPYLPAALQSQMTATGTESFRLARFGLDIPVGHLKFSNTAWTVTAGLDGKFSGLGSDWNWNAYYTHGEARLHMEQTSPENAKVYASLDAVRDPASGNIVCRITLTNPGRMPGCVPVNMFGPGSVSAAAINYFTGVSEYHTRNQSDEAGFNIGGTPFGTWAGPVAFSVGGDFRRQSLVQTSNSDPLVPVDFTGIRGIARTPRFAFTNVGVANGSYQVKEVYSELAVPLAKDVPFAKSLEINGAVRYTDYSTFGSKVTWKAGLSWEPYDDLRIRATRSRDIRAPSLYEAFAGQQLSPATFFDAGVSGRTDQILTLSGGNSNLKPEVADTTTIGGVFKPSWLPGFSGSVDFYNIKIDGAITTFPANTSRDVCVRSNGTDPLCANIIRPGPFSDKSPTNFPTLILTYPVNYGSLNVNGVDFDFSYRTGSWTFGAVVSYLAKYEVNPGGGLPVRELAGTGGTSGGGGAEAYSKWRSLFSVSYDANGLGVYLAARTIGGVKRDTPRNTGLVFVDNEIKAQTYVDATVSYDFNAFGDGNSSVFLTVNNLFNRKAPIIPISSIPAVIIPTMAGTYDILGRRFTAGVRFKM